MSKNLVQPSAVRKSDSLSPLLWIICFSGEEQPYLLVGITRLPQDLSSEHLSAPELTSKIRLSSLESAQWCLTQCSEPRLQLTVTESLVCLPLYPKLLFPSVYKHSLWAHQQHWQAAHLLNRFSQELGWEKGRSWNTAEAGYEPGWAQQLKSCIRRVLRLD